MARQIDSAKDIVTNYSVEDVIAYLDRGLALALNDMDKAIVEQNLAHFGSNASLLAEIYKVTHELNKKMNGSKPNEVL